MKEIDSGPKRQEVYRSGNEFGQRSDERHPYSHSKELIVALKNQLSIPDSFPTNNQRLDQITNKREVYDLTDWVNALQVKPGSERLVANLEFKNGRANYMFSTDGTYPQNLNPNSKVGILAGLVIGEARLRAVLEAMPDAYAKGKSLVKREIAKVQANRQLFIQEIDNPAIKSLKDLMRVEPKNSFSVTSVAMALPKVAILTSLGLAACQPILSVPQVVVESSKTPISYVASPTSTRFKTPTPRQTETPTPSPESLLPQEVKEKFELAEVDPANMENAEYDKNGLHITLPSGEVIVLTNTELQKGIYNGQDNVLQYRDEANQNVIYAFDKESGKWGVGISEAESAAIALFDKYGVAPDTYTLTEVDGVIVGTDKETGTEIFRDGRFEINYAVEIAKKDCESTNIIPEKDSVFAQQKDEKALSKYIHTLLDDLNFNRSDGSFFLAYVLVDREKQCWAFADGDNLVYRNETGIVQPIPTNHLTEDEVFTFILNR